TARQPPAPGTRWTGQHACCMMRCVLHHTGGGMRRTWTGLALGAALWAAGCATNPVTGRTELALISESQEIAMGQEAAAQVEASIGVIDDAELNAYVQRVGESLARDSERPQLPWRFRVVDDPTPNACALPG